VNVPPVSTAILITIPPCPVPSICPPGIKFAIIVQPCKNVPWQGGLETTRQRLLALRSQTFRISAQRHGPTDSAFHPGFSKHDRPNLQSRIVLLYFLFGWSCARSYSVSAAPSKRTADLKNMGAAGSRNGIPTAHPRGASWQIECIFKL